MESQVINSLFRKSLFNRLGLLVFIFTIALVSILWYQFNYSHTTQDSILDAHENYFYSQMVSRWGNPPDTNFVKKEIKNLHMWCGIFKREKDETGVTYPGIKYWSNLPKEIIIDELIGQSIPIYLYEISHGTEKSPDEAIIFYSICFILFYLYHLMVNGD